jgi:hypothetical protein
MRVKSGVSSEAVNQAATHSLFVEGSGQEAIDPRALSRLLRDTGISVKALGPSFHIKSAAQALHPHHPNYYFIIDRDHHDDDVVNETWTNFPDPDTHNLLIWRKRELENYFLEPSYLSRSSYCKIKLGALKEKLLKISAERIFFDLANQTIAKIREIQKTKWIEDFTDPSSFSTSAKALEQLKAHGALSSRPALTAEQLKFDTIAKIFGEREKELLAGTNEPEFGKGTWLDQMRGKFLLSVLINECFDVKDSNNIILRGKEAVTLVAVELLQMDIKTQPSDFQELHKLILARVPTKP